MDQKERILSSNSRRRTSTELAVTTKEAQAPWVSHKTPGESKESNSSFFGFEIKLVERSVLHRRRNPTSRFHCQSFLVIIMDPPGKECQQPSRCARPCQSVDVHANSPASAAHQHSNIFVAF